MLISHSHRFIYIHTGKTGGMSMREVLIPLCEEPEKFKIRRPSKTKDGAPNPLYTVWETLLLHPTAREVRRELPKDVFDSYFKFAFVRNPWDLQVSMYHFILREPGATNHDVVKGLGSFEAFLDWVAATPNPFPKGITKLQKDMLVDEDGSLMMDFIGYYERLSNDFAEVGRRMGFDGTLPHLNKSKHSDYRNYYDERTRTLVAETFAADIALFGYDFDGIVP
jgi:hypothetical protein